ncbi:MAG: type II secretion system protein [Acidobacteria bacterium]|nr:type II secretion system protein [Acidobacteriota bacterium]MBK9706530.1 type II secretion system protein [Acidobacteriota bacterium]
MKIFNRTKQLRPEVDGSRRSTQRGFTFMELLIVMVIIGILAAVAIPVYVAHVRRAKEVSLQSDLWAMRRAIDYYATDKEKPPSTLQELVAAGYLRDIPKDPICPECPWTEIAAPTDSSVANAPSGIGDVKSSAPGNDANGKPFTEY